MGNQLSLALVEKKMGRRAVGVSRSSHLPKLELGVVAQAQITSIRQNSLDPSSFGDPNLIADDDRIVRSQFDDFIRAVLDQIGIAFDGPDVAVVFVIQGVAGCQRDGNNKGSRPDPGAHWCAVCTTHRSNLL